MNIEMLSMQLEQIDSVRATVIKDTNRILVTTQLENYTLEVDCKYVLDTKFISSPMGEECLQIFYTDNGGIIVTPDDFVFNVEQDGYIHVANLPPMCSIRELVSGFKSYIENPNPSKNIDENLGQFYLHLYIFKSAIVKGFEIPMIDELYKIGSKNGFLLNG